MNKLQIYILTSPTASKFVGLLGSLLGTCVSGAVLDGYDFDKHSGLDKGIAMFFGLFGCICFVLILVQIKDLLFIFKLKKLEQAEILQRAKLGDETALRYLRNEQSRRFDLILSVGEGVPPTANEEITPEQKPQKPYPEIELIEDGDKDKYLFKIEGRTGYSLFQTIADDYSIRKSKGEQNEAFREAQYLYQEARSMRNKAFIDRFVEAYNIDIRQDLLNVYFKDPKLSNQTTQTFLATGLYNQVLPYVENRMRARDFNINPPEPREPFLRLTKIEVDPVELNRIPYGCVFKVVSFQTEKND